MWLTASVLLSVWYFHNRNIFVEFITQSNFAHFSLTHCLGFCWHTKFIQFYWKMKLLSLSTSYLLMELEGFWGPECKSQQLLRTDERINIFLLSIVWHQSLFLCYPWDLVEIADITDNQADLTPHQIWRGDFLLCFSDVCTTSDTLWSPYNCWHANNPQICIIFLRLVNWNSWCRDLLSSSRPRKATELWFCS